MSSFVNRKFLSDSFRLLYKFGVGHAFRRFYDLLRVKIYERKRNKRFHRLLASTPKHVVKKVLDFQMELDLNDFGIHRDLFLDGIREPIATAHLKSLLNPDSVVLEVGANIGYYVLMESKICRKIYAIEPVRQNIQNLKRNLAINKCKNIEVYELALGDKNGTLSINISSKSNLHSFYPHSGTVAHQQVEMLTGDDFIKNKEAPTFVRMDVEGYELNIIRGMAQTLKRVNNIFMEIHSDIMSLPETRELIDLLHQAGFQPELIVKYDRPGLSKLMPMKQIKNIYRGDAGGYEVFWKKA